MQLLAQMVVLNGKDYTVYGLYALLGLCLLNVFFPRAMWWWDEGWKFRDATEPSGLWLAFTRLAGLVGAVFVLYYLQHPEKLTKKSAEIAPTTVALIVPS